MKDVVIFGAGSVGRLSEQILSDINAVQEKFNLLGYLDDDESKFNNSVNKVSVLGGIDWLKSHPNVYVILGFSNPKQKCELIKRLKEIDFAQFVTLIHPTSWISNRVTIGTGSILYPGVLIDVDVTIGNFSLLNKVCTVGHDTHIDNYTTISPGVNIGGFNKIYEGAEFGINSCSVQKIIIGKWAVIGAGAVIIKDVPDNAVVVGNPGRIIKYNNV